MNVLLAGEQLALLAALVTAGMLVQTATGFGSNLVIISIGASMMPIQELIAVILPANMLQSLIITLRQGRHARTKLLTHRVLPWMGLGVVLGLALAALVTGDWLKACLGVFILGVSARRLFELFWVRVAVSEEPEPDEDAVPRLGLIGAGIFHGLYATAGPALVWALTRARLDRVSSRATLAMIWLSMNLILATGLLLSGKFTFAHLTLGVLMLPALGLGYALGEQVHKILPERLLRGLIYGVLFLAGCSLIVKGLF